MAERTELLKCTCQHEFQDATYGNGVRVHNVNAKGEAFCTVCSPSYRRNKNSTTQQPNSAFGNGLIPSRPGRNAKKVTH